MENTVEQNFLDYQKMCIKGLINLHLAVVMTNEYALKNKLDTFKDVTPEDQKEKVKTIEEQKELNYKAMRNLTNITDKDVIDCILGCVTMHNKDNDLLQTLLFTVKLLNDEKILKLMAI